MEPPHSSSTSTTVVNVEHLEIEPADDTQIYQMDDITIPNAYELHVKAKNISALVAYESIVLY